MSATATAAGRSAMPIKRWSLFDSRSGIAILSTVLVLLAAIAAGTQRARDARYATDLPAEQVLYVQSPAMMQRMVLSYDALAADIYWIRALQQFGRARLSARASSEYESLVQASSAYELAFPLLSQAAPFGVVAPAPRSYTLLYPLLDMATTLDPLFKMAYRFGAIFLSEPPPGGPGRPDQAIALLEKGIAASPDRWQYYQDAGFVHYWARRDFVKAAEWFERAARIQGAPYWLKQLAANTLAVGGSRQASRTLYRALAQSPDNEFVKGDAERRLQQLDALDLRDQLQAMIDDYRARGGHGPSTWQSLIRAGLLRRVPTDPTGAPFLLEPLTGTVTVHPKSSLQPLPDEPPAVNSSRPPA